MSVTATNIGLGEHRLSTYDRTIVGLSIADAWESVREIDAVPDPGQEVQPPLQIEHIASMNASVNGLPEALRQNAKLLLLVGGVIAFYMVAVARTRKRGD